MGLMILLQVQLVVLLLVVSAPALAVRSHAAHTSGVAEIAERRVLDAVIDLVAARSVSGSAHSAGAHAHALGGPEAVALVVRWWSPEDHVRVREGSSCPGVLAVSVGDRGGLGVAENDIEVGLLGG